MTPFKDHFSGHAALYAAARPHYPDALYAWLAAQVPARRLAVDVGCGNGQATLALAAHFERVIGIDPSAQQLAAAPAHPRVRYEVRAAEDLAAIDADLVTVAQALHWFDVGRFYQAVNAALAPGGVLAAWSYGLMRCDPLIDEELDALEASIRPWWPPERAHVDSGYRSLPFPFAEIPAPAFDMEAHWTLAQLLDYLRTWSAVRRHDQASRADVIADVTPALTRAWGDPARVRRVFWPLVLRVGRVA